MSTTLTANGIIYGDKTEEYSAYTGLGRAVFGFGYSASGNVNIKNHVNGMGLIDLDVTNAETPRSALSALSFGKGKGIFSFGTDGSANKNISVIVNENGVFSSEINYADSTISYNAGSTYDYDKGVFAFGYSVGSSGLTNNKTLVTNLGILGSSTASSGTARYFLGAAPYGSTNAIFCFGYDASTTNVKTLFDNTGTVTLDQSTVGVSRYGVAAATYGGNNERAIFGFGNNGSSYLNAINLVNSAGAVDWSITYSSSYTARTTPAASSYGGDKAIFGFGYASNGYFSSTNLISNLGVMATNVTNASTARSDLAACGYSS